MKKVKFLIGFGLGVLPALVILAYIIAEALK